jgi:serine/threonine protein kinase/Tfp pilus assembly protein PilF
MRAMPSVPPDSKLPSKPPEWLGRFSVLSLVGEGGMGKVYKARGPQGELVAIKVLSRGATTDPNAMARFDRERRLQASLGEEDGFVPLLEHGATERGIPFLVMPFLPGGTLRDRLEATRQLGIEETVEIGQKVARALGRAHEIGIVHRDLKPENVLFAADGRPFVSDLGLAKHFVDGPGEHSASISRAGTMVGTVRYMAPEQADSAKFVDPRADIFSLGAILHECLAGSPAFDGDSAVDILRAVLRGVPAQPLERARPEVPAGLATIVRRALAREPEDRFADGKALAEALDSVRLTRAPSLASRRRRRRILAGASALWVVVLGLVFVGPRLLAQRRLQQLVASAETHEKKAEHAAAAADLALALELDPRSASLQARRAEALRQQGDLEKAIAAATRAIELDPQLAAAWRTRSLAHMTRKDYQDAVADATNALNLSPLDASVLVARAKSRANGKGSDYDGAIADCTKALAIDPRSAAAFTMRAEAHFSLAHLDEALSDATRAIDLEPKNAWAYMLRGGTQSRLKQPDLAIADLSHAIELDPRLDNAWFLRGRERLKKGDVDGALADSTRASEISPGMAPAWQDRGAAKAFLGDHDGAFDDLSRAIELGAVNAEVFANRGAMRSYRQEWAAEIDDLSRALALDPRYTMALSNRGYARWKLGDLKGGIEDVSRAIELDPGFVRAWYVRGEIRASDPSMRADAVSDLENVIAIADPRSGFASEARRVLATLR